MAVKKGGQIAVRNDRPPATVKGRAQSDDGFAQLLTNLFLARDEFLRRSIDGPKRNLNKECGYPENIEVEDYKLMYDREAMPNRVVNVYPDESWAQYPEITEIADLRTTKFERGWEELVHNPATNPWHYLHRVDEISGIGHFGILFLGFGDGRDPNEPVSNLNSVTGLRKPRTSDVPLRYMRTFDESIVTVAEYEKDWSSPRHGMPVSYNVMVGDFESRNVQDVKSQNIHWTRCIHVADNRKDSEVYGVPRQKPVYNRLFDLRKVLGSSSEMFWKGGFPGYSFEALPDVEDPDIDEDSIRKQMEQYQNGLQRYIAAVGMKITSLAPQVASPENHTTQQLAVIAACLKVPLRILMGAEAGHLASTQDLGLWNRRLAGRQRNYLTPWVINPFVGRLVETGSVPRPQKGWRVDWTDLNSMTEETKADVALKKSQALLQYVTSGSETIIPPKEYLTYFLDLPTPVVEAILKAVASSG
jgi:hypothetical protein